MSVPWDKACNRELLGGWTSIPNHPRVVMKGRHCWVGDIVCNNEKCSKLEQGWLVGRPVTPY